MSESKIHL